MAPTHSVSFDPNTPLQSHVYEKGDLPKLFAPISGWVSVQDEYYDAGNWCVVCRRDK